MQSRKTDKRMQDNKRLLSLDILRGLTIAGMILVNNPGSWATVYPPLLHADWHGCTPTDWVFPFFLFMVGVAIPIALGKRLQRGDAPGTLRAKILSRTLLIFGFGLFLAAFPDFGMDKENTPPAITSLHYLLMGLFMVGVLYRGVLIAKYPDRKRQQRLALYGLIALALGMAAIGFSYYDFSHLRIPGVLQRIALVYCACAFIFLNTNWKGQIYWGIGLLLGYWVLMRFVPVPGGLAPNLAPETNLGAWLDRFILGTNHLWSQSKVWDPEGLLSTLPAIATGICGMLCGHWMLNKKPAYEKAAGLFVIGVVLLALGHIWSMEFPINKKIWTSSYVLYTAGVAFLFLGLIYWLADIKGRQGWAKPFVIYGTNALTVYIFSGIFAELSFVISWVKADGTRTSLQSWLYHTFFTPYLSDFNASLAYAVCFVLLLYLVAWVMYRRKVFIRV
ncbi:MAG TPA: DUF5009 domain-containing protein [Saprospiraceae bacterium]|nr:DUF5009 domain-containing protein [Saprospiraceae bacterium]HMQ82348.1 DUF5009 domain-containing protein [Saprospiraceae bacterium]